MGVPLGPVLLVFKKNVQLFSNRFSVTKTHSQHFRHAYAYNSTATEHHGTLYRVFYRTAYAHTILAHDALHCKNLENRDTLIEHNI